MTTPPRPVSSWSGRRPIRTGARPPCARRYARRRVPSASAIVPAGTSTSTGTAFASPGRLSTSTSPIPPARQTRSAFAAKVHSPRVTSAIAPRSDRAGSGFGPPLGLAAGPHRRASTGLPLRPTIEPTSTSGRLFETHAAGVPPRPGWNGKRRDAAFAAMTWSAGAKTWVFDAAATEIASGATPGDPAEPRPNSSRSFPAEITGTTPAAATFATASTSASFCGSAWGPPPEKLITSIPSRTAASKAAMISGVLATTPTGVGTVNTR